MDPNKIHIDELVRQRLQGGEEEPRPGAWIAMRELLDKQMPMGTRPLGGLAWGRAARWTTALVLFTLMAGGYGVMDIRRAAREGASENTGLLKSASTAATRSADGKAVRGDKYIVPASSASDAVTSASGSLQDVAVASSPASRNAVDGHRSSKLSSAVATSTTASLPAPLAVNAIAPASTKRDGEASTQRASTQSVVRPRRSRVASVIITPARTASSRANNIPSARLTAATGNLAETAAADSETAQTATETSTSTPSARNTGRATERSSANVAATKSSAHRSRESAKGNTSAETLSSAARTESPRSLRTRNARGGTTKTISIPDSIKAQVQRDTVQPIRIAHRYMGTRGLRGGRYVVDTLTAPPYVIERPLPVVATSSEQSKTTANARTRRRIFGKKANTSAKGLASTTTTPDKEIPAAAVVKKPSTPVVAPAASASVTTASANNANGEALVPLSSKMVRSTKSDKMQYSAQEQIQDVMRRTQFLFGQMRLYTGATGGFNASVGGTSMGGFHAGLFGLLAINDRWSAGVEAKFVQRFNRGTELHDPYFQYTGKLHNSFSSPNGEAYKVYRVTTDSFSHYYKLSTIETVEFPVYARYSFRRFHAFGGANLAYGLRVKNIERVERFAGRESGALDTVLASTQYAPQPNTAAVVKLEDFGPRFGIGYTAGVGFQASPAVLVDVRMTQLVWDNRSAGSGGLRVSQTFYRVPSLQLSIGYRFSQQMGRR